MAGGFSFPPPPPPPPRAVASEQCGYEDRRERGDSRGGGRGGREQSFSSGSQRSGRGDSMYSRGSRGDSNQQTRSYAGRGGSQRGSFHSSQNSGTSEYRPSSQQYPQAPFPLPPGAHINPAFHARLNGPPENSAGRSNQNRSGTSYDPTDHAASTFGGQKRKRDPPEARGGHGSWRGGSGAPPTTLPHPMKRTTLPKVAPPPAVPSFGSPIFSAVQKSPSTNNRNQQPPTTAKSKPASTKDLGLLRSADHEWDHSESSSDEEEDLDEEELWHAKPDALTFEFNGEKCNLDSAAAIKAWVAERRHQFPTPRRIQEKREEAYVEMEERRRIEQETREATMSRMQQSAPALPTTGRDHEQKALATVDAAEPTPAADVPLAGDENAEHSDDDSAPEEEAIQTAPPQALDRTPPTRSDRICHIFKATGRCKFGQRCNYQHIQPDSHQRHQQGRQNNDRSANGATGKKTLYQRFLDQEREEEHKMALEAIKYLGKKGFFRKQTDDPK